MNPQRMATWENVKMDASMTPINYLTKLSGDEKNVEMTHKSHQNVYGHQSLYAAPRACIDPMD